MQKSRDFWPVKTALHLSEITGYSTRAAENWLSGKAVLPADALAELLHSEQGREFLSVAMTDYTPRWWLLLKSWLKQIDIEAARRHEQRLMKEWLDETAAAQPGPHSAFVSDPVFHAGQPAPSHSLGPKKHNRR